MSEGQGEVMRSAMCVLIALTCALVAACGDKDSADPTVVSSNSREISTEISISQALESRGDKQVDILFEARLREIPAVAERVSELKQQLDRNYINNSLCMAMSRGTIGKTAFICNDNDYDVMILVRESGQSITENLRYIEEFAGDPLRSSLTRAIQLIGPSEINEADVDCARIAFLDSGTGEVRKDMPILLMIMPNKLMAQTSNTDRDLQRCLQ